MKKLILLLFIPLVSFGQIDKIGYSKAQLLNSVDAEPCKSDYNSIWYCGNNGGLVNYGFEYNKVSSVLYMTNFSSKYLAEQDVQKEINRYKGIYGKPTMKGNEAYFFLDDLLVMISYGYTNGKHYSCWRVSKR
tara:strand:+ start:100 stop:498 length:399 start_codon:yes stop_codon:yes gene_type:complete